MLLDVFRPIYHQMSSFFVLPHNFLFFFFSDCLTIISIVHQIKRRIDERDFVRALYTPAGLNSYFTSPDVVVLQHLSIRTQTLLKWLMEWDVKTIENKVEKNMMEVRDSTGENKKKCTRATGTKTGIISKPSGRRRKPTLPEKWWPCRYFSLFSSAEQHPHILYRHHHKSWYQSIISSACLLYIEYI